VGNPNIEFAAIRTQVEGAQMKIEILLAICFPFRKWNCKSGMKTIHSKILHHSTRLSPLVLVNQQCTCNPGGSKNSHSKTFVHCHLSQREQGTQGRIPYLCLELVILVRRLVLVPQSVLVVQAVQYKCTDGSRGAEHALAPRPDATQGSIFEWR
jgi:hypothetical protein